ncbi:MAG: cation:proton antiporter [Bacteroidales bacterium]|nr:cation:proton antiporter [Bacteroidales bacterium]
MEKITIIVIILGGLIFFSHLLNKLFDKTKIPNVLILITIGIIAGLFIDSKIFFGEVGRVFTTITLIIILFESGVGLKLQELKSSILSATLVTIINFIFSVGIVVGITMWLADFDFTSALFLGSILGGTSSAVVIPMVRQLNMGQKAGTVLLLESAFTDVLCLVVGLAVLESMKAGNLEASSILINMTKSFLLAILLGLASGFAWSLLLNWIRGIKNSMFTTLALVFIVYGGAELLGLNGGIAALSFGIVLGNSEYFDKMKLWKKIFKIETAKLNDNEKNFFSEIVFVLQTYFFVYIGIVIEFGTPLIYLISVMIVCIVILARIPTIRLLVRKDCTPDDKLLMSIMMPKGLVPAILASIPLQEGLPYGQEIAEIGYAVVLTSIVMCSLLIIVLGKKKKTEVQTDTSSSVLPIETETPDENTAEATNTEQLHEPDNN